MIQEDGVRHPVPSSPQARYELRTEPRREEVPEADAEGPLPLPEAGLENGGDEEEPDDELKPLHLGPVDLDGPRVLFATEGREADTFRVFREDLEAHGGHPDRIWEVCVDLSAACRKGQREHLPHARITFDRFHVVKLRNEAVDQVRRAERKEAAELNRTRYLWLKNASNLSRSQQRHLVQLLPGQRHLRTVKAHQMKLALQDFWGLSASEAGASSTRGAVGPRGVTSAPWPPSP